MPLRGRAGVADTHFRFELEPLQVFADAPRARRIAFERDELEIGEFEQMAGLAAGRRAGVEHAHAVAHAEQRRGELRAGVLHRNDALAETGNAVYRHRRGELDGVVAGLARGNVMVLQHLQIGVDRRVTGVHAQCERALRVAGGEHRLPGVGPGAFHRVDPPRRVVPEGHFVGLRGREQRLALTQETAQHRVDEPLGEREFTTCVDGADRLIDHRERRVRGARFVVDE